MLVRTQSEKNIEGIKFKALVELRYIKIFYLQDRRRKTTPAEDRYLRLLATRNRRRTAREFQEDFQNATVQRRNTEIGSSDTGNESRFVMKPKLLCLVMMYVLVCGEHHIEDVVIDRVPFRGGALMLWGGITLDMRTELVVIRRRRNQKSFMWLSSGWIFAHRAFRPILRPVCDHSSSPTDDPGGIRKSDANKRTIFPGICRHLRWVGHVARMGESRNAYRVLVGRPEENRPLGRPRRRWEDNIKMDLREVEYDGREWINLAQCSKMFSKYEQNAELKFRLQEARMLDNAMQQWFPNFLKARPTFAQDFSLRLPLHYRIALYTSPQGVTTHTLRTTATQHYWTLLVERLHHIVPWLGGHMHYATGGKMFIKKHGTGRPQSASDDVHVNAVRVLLEENRCWTCIELKGKLELLLVRFFT
ncbi:hypothetical protein ANN_03281 [Periplaneta americana]|uniref:Uncharacterized protein n=1 Tax=Periplaneta americana TaxID=6978 RepID=A0ABQ8U0B1_PERAM|nr:hypothetical protein ANN_03281 [Periplaneta americana]